MQMYMFVIEVLQKSKYLHPPGQPFSDTPLGYPRHLQLFFFKCTTALWSGKENLILTMHPFGQSQSKIIVVSGNVDQSKPDSHFNSQIDPYISCIFIECVCSKMQHKCLGEHSTQPLGELTKYNRLPNALAEEVEGGLNNFRVRRTI